MTRHEALAYLNVIGEPLSKNDLRDRFSIAKSTASESVNRMRRDGLVQAIRIVGREAYYGLTEKGKERLDYFDENGCGNEGCRCHR
jgi:Mn-dependent DtxR family transcriptional regulator